jgi:hypothetical protein
MAEEPRIDRAALAAWLETTDHLYDCIGYSEGQACCLDKERVLAALDTFIRVPPPEPG